MMEMVNELVVGLVRGAVRKAWYDPDTDLKVWELADQVATTWVWGT